MGDLLFEHLFSFWKTFKKITKGVRFDLQHKMQDQHSIIHTTMSDDIRVLLLVYLKISIFHATLCSTTGFQRIWEEGFPSKSNEWVTTR